MYIVTAPTAAGSKIHQRPCSFADQMSEPRLMASSAAKSGRTNAVFMAKPSPSDANELPSAGMQAGQTIAAAEDSTEATLLIHRAGAP